MWAPLNQPHSIQLCRHKNRPPKNCKLNWLSKPILLKKNNIIYQGFYFFLLLRRRTAGRLPIKILTGYKLDIKYNFSMMGFVNMTPVYLKVSKYRNRQRL